MYGEMFYGRHTAQHQLQCNFNVIQLDVMLHLDLLLLLFCGLMSQSIAMVMSRRSVNPNTLFLGKLQDLSGLPILSADPFARNWQLPYLNQWYGKNGRRNYFMTNLHEKYVAGPEDRTCDRPHIRRRRIWLS